MKKRYRPAVLLMGLALTGAAFFGAFVTHHIAFSFLTAYAGVSTAYLLMRSSLWLD